jgi:hypothetical protein
MGWIERGRRARVAEEFSVEFNRRDGVVKVSGGDKAWVERQVGSLVVALAGVASDAPPPPPPADLAGAGEGEGTGRKQPPKRRRPASTKPAGSGGREDVGRLLRETPLEDFPEGAEDASAGVAAFAVLRWARDILGHDGLTASEIHSFLHNRLRQPNSVNAYRNAFKRDPRAVTGSGNPVTWRLMAPGEAALDAYLKERAAGGTAPQAEAAAREAEDASV